MAARVAMFSLVFPGFLDVWQGGKILGKFGVFLGKKQNNQGKEGQGWEPSDELQDKLGPSGPEIQKESTRSLPEPPAPGSQKLTASKLP